MPHSSTPWVFFIQAPVPLLIPACLEIRFSVTGIYNVHEHNPLISLGGSNQELAWILAVVSYGGMSPNNPVPYLGR